MYLAYGISSFFKLFDRGLYIVLWTPTVIMMGKSASQPIWVSNGGSRAYLCGFHVGGLHVEAVAAVCKFKSLDF